jgi:3-deoxy-D-manno-octulosonic-acid transferase
MGADPGKISVQGNAKYDLLANQADPELETEMRRKLGLEPNRMVLIAGSTRGGEEAIVLDAYEEILREFPETILVIAPRHITRTPEIEAMLRGRGLAYQLRTDLGVPGSQRTEGVLIMNTFGELFKLYSVGTIVFCGASLVPLGGQNPLEAGVWGKVVFYGPSMDDFLDARALLEEVGAGIQVAGARDLSEKALDLLKNQEHLKTLGRKGRESILQSQGAADKHAEAITRLLQS